MGLLHYLYIPLFLLYVGLFLWFIFRSKLFGTEGINRKHMAFFFLLKVSAGVLLTLIYTYYYKDASKADIHRYFNDSKIISSVLFTDPQAWLHIITGVGMQDARVFVYLLPTLHFSHPVGDMATNNGLIIRLISLLNYFSFYNIYIDTLFFDFISFTGLVLLYKTFQKFVPGDNRLLYLPLFLLPSVIFWGSGLLKEPIIIFALGLFVHSISRQSEGHRWRNIIFALMALLLIAAAKIYIAALLILTSVFLPLPISPTKKVALYLFIIVAGWHFAGAGLCEKIIDKRNEFITLAINENSGSSVDTQFSDADCPHLLKLLPSSFVNSILRPFVWDKGKIFQKAFALENTLLFLLLAFLLIRYLKFPERSSYGIVAFCLFFALANYTIIGISIPVMGAIVHYRIIAMLFLVAAVSMLVRLAPDKT